MEIIDIAFVGLYLIATLYLGLTGKRPKSFREYAISNQQITTPILVATIAATLIGGGSSSGLASKIFTYGLPFLVIFLCRPLVNLFLGYVVAPRMGPFMGRISIGEMSHQLYGKSGQVTIGIASIIRSFAQVATQVTAIGFIFEYFLGIDFTSGCLLGSAIIIVYTGFGGIQGVVRTDVFQFLILIVSIPFVTNIGAIEIGGYTKLFHAVKSTHLRFSLEEFVSGPLFAWFLLELIPGFDGNTAQRFLMAPNIATMKKSMIFAAWLQIPFYILIATLGLIAVSLDPSLDPNLALPHVLMQILPIGLKGMAVAAVLAIVMSSADSYLNIAGIVLINDVVMPLRKRELSEKMKLLFAKGLTLAIGIISVFVAIGFKDVLAVAFSLAKFWFPISTIPLYAGIFGWRFSEASFVASVVGAISTTFLWEHYFPETATILPSFIIGMGGSFVCLLGYQLATVNHIGCAMTKSLPTSHLRQQTSFQQTLKSFWHFRLNRLDQGSVPGVAFGIFCLLVYNLPSFMWEGGPAYILKHLYMVKFMGSLLCIGLVLQPYFPQWWRGYFPLYWHFTLCFNLPFIFMLYGLVSNFDTFSLINLSMGLFLLVLLTHWQVYIVLFFTGQLLALGLYQFWCIQNCYEFSDHSFAFFLLSTVFAGLLGSVFSRKKQASEHGIRKGLIAQSRQLAHELRTPLMTLSIYSQSLEKALKATSPQLDKIRKIQGRYQAELSRATELVTAMLSQTDVQDSFSPALVPLNLRALIQKSVELYPADENFKSTHFHIQKSGIDIAVKTRPSIILQVLYNLYRNSIEACPDCTITIEALQEESYAILTISDNGPGIDDRIVERVFDPLFTTKSNGNGIGLAFSKEQLERIGCFIELQSLPGKGATFKIAIPLEKKV